MGRSSAPRRGFRLARPRLTLATRLLLGGFALSLAIIAGISAYLLVSRDQQARSAALSSAQSRAEAFAELVSQVAIPEARYAASDLARLPEMAAALSSADPKAAVSSLLHGPASVVRIIPDQGVAVFDASGGFVASATPAGFPTLSASLPATQQALEGTAAESFDRLTTSTPLDDLAAPVRSAAGNRMLGVVVVSLPLPSALIRLVGAIGTGYTPLMVANRPGAPLEVLSGSEPHPALRAAPLPGALAGHLGGGATELTGFTTSSSGDSALALSALSAPGGPPPLFVGVETPLQPFLGDQSGEALSILWVALTALLVTWLMVLLFVNRFVRRPVAQLAAGVGRIAGGDYSSDIPIRSEDELGVLAHQVNRLRAQIESNVRHVDHAVRRLDEVSRALTTTTAGVASLESAVCAAAGSIAGPRACAWIFENRDGAMRLHSRGPGALPDPELPDRAVGDLLSGRASRFSARSGGARLFALAIPFSYREQVTGAMVVSTPEPLPDADIRALSALANNAAIALENTRLFEGERETVRRLRELDEMKSDFLATAQHELRTPLTAIVGHVELLRMVWTDPDQTKKLGIVDNIELAASQLSEMLETMIDLSLMSADNLRLHRRRVEVADAVRDAVADVSRRFPRGLGVTLRVDVPPRLGVDADPERLRQVIRCLLDNAVKFGRDGEEVLIAAGPGATPDRCAIAITDHGIGIDPSLHDRVFERFFQVDRGGTRAYGGMGVGLALVKVLVEAHGAEISLESALKKGTTVRLDWPAVFEDEEIASAEVAVDITASRRPPVHR